MSASKVAVVTGGNKGIGYAIVKGLCEKFEGTVYLTARDVGRGEEAVKKLKALGFNPAFHQLDINDQKSVDSLKEHLQKTHGGLDLLVNNAAIAYPASSTVPIGKQAEDTIAVNYFSLLRVCESLFPLLRDNARVVNLSSVCGHLSQIPSADLRAKLNSPTLTISQLNEMMNNFVKSAKAGKTAEDGWHSSPYFVSKVGVSALTKIQQRIFDESGKNIYVNSVHPGYVDTDMTSHKGPLTIEEGASAPLFLAVGAHKLKGAYVWRDSTVWDWNAPNTPAPYQASTVPFGKQAEDTVAVNYFSLLRVCESLFSLLRDNARVVNVSSSCGHLSKIPTADKRSKFDSPTLTVSQLNDMMNEFVNSAKAGKNAEDGWGTSAYNVSKVGVSALTKIHQRMFDESGKNIFVNSVHPGYVDTDMTNHKGPLTIEEGASAPLFLAVGAHNLKGAYVWKDSTAWDWNAPNTPAVV